MNEFYNEVEKKAATLKCACGNADWKQFLYVVVGAAVLAGCKLCGNSYEYDNGAWTLKAKGPGGKRR